MPAVSLVMEGRKAHAIWHANSAVRLSESSSGIQGSPLLSSILHSSNGTRAISTSGVVSMFTLTPAVDSE
jgi:hypothetical protein